jgi:hypothetical protein
MDNLAGQPGLSGLPWRPNSKIMAAFIAAVTSNQRIQTLVNQIRAGHGKVVAGIYWAVGMESAHEHFLSLQVIQCFKLNDVGLILYCGQYESWEPSWDRRTPVRLLF